MRNNKIYFILLALLGAAALSTTIYTTASKSAEEPTASNKPAQVSLVDIGPGGVGAADQVETTGRVKSDRQASISAERSGVVKQVNASMGQFVSAGQLLLRLDTAEAEADLSQAKASLKAARSREQSSGIQSGNAELQLQNAVQGAQTTIQDVKETKLAQFFSNKEELTDFGMSLSQGNTVYYISARPEREAPSIRDTSRQFTAAWRTAQISAGSIERSAEATEQALLALRELLDAVGYHINKYSAEDTTEQVIYDPLQNKVSAGRSAVSSSLSSLRSAIQTLRNSQVTDTGAQVEQARAQVQAAEARLAKGYVRAPFAGTVTAVEPRVGESVSAGQQLVTLVNRGHLRVTAGVSPATARRISIGSAATIDEETGGEVSALSSAVDPATGKVEVTIKASDSRADLIVGEFVDVSISLPGASKKSESNGIWVPLSAVQTRSDGASVFIVENGRAKRTPVEVGRITGDGIILTAGLDGISKLIADARQVEEGQAIEIETSSMK